MPFSLFAIVIFSIVHLIALAAAGHAVCYKRDSRSAVCWVALIFLVPLLGSLAYFWFGINRVKRRARGLKGKPPRSIPIHEPVGADSPADAHPALTISGRINRGRLSQGNSLQMLVNGEAAYPRMLRAIGEAKKNISLVTYIFDNDSVGREFAEALCAAAKRGVEVRVLIDAVGARYSFPSIFRRLRCPKLKAAKFLDTMLPWRFHYSQLRNHRKCLITDGRLAFTGGMNIREGHLVTRLESCSTQDLQFQVEGPVVTDLQKVFAQDWEFTTKEVLGHEWFPPEEKVKNEGGWARVVNDGPDEDFEKLRWTLLSVLGVARKSVCILTPYFLPDPVLISMLGLTALRGVKVEIIVPEHTNVFMVQWASRAIYWQVLERGCRIYASPGPFDHSKLFVVDDAWAMVGSANWDARSLRLNFEMNIEVQDPDIVAILGREFARKKSLSRLVTLAEVDARSLPVRLRDGTARLFSPYL